MVSEVETLAGLFHKLPNINTNVSMTRCLPSLSQGEGLRMNIYASLYSSYSSQAIYPPRRFFSSKIWATAHNLRYPTK
jgi:hypothetical protein